MIFANANVTDQALDYLRYPTPQQLWQQLDQGCREQDGCEAIVIPHNTNMGDGKGFDVESEPTDLLSLRARFERLVEIHQQKGNSECLPEFNSEDEGCAFERYLTLNSVPTPAAQYTETQWKKCALPMSGDCCSAALKAYTASAEEQRNPLQPGHHCLNRYPRGNRRFC